MAPRLPCGWIAVVVAALLPGFQAVQAAPVSGAQSTDLHNSAIRAAFRLPGRGLTRLPRTPGVRPRATPKRLFNRAPNGSSRTNAAGGRTSVDTGPLAAGGRSGVPRNPRGGPPGLVIVPGAIAAVTAFTILGAGGVERPPIAPGFTGNPGQGPEQVAAALLDNKRHRPRELLIEVSAETPDSLKQSLAREYQGRNCGSWRRRSCWRADLASHAAPRPGLAPSAHRSITG